MDGEKSEHPAGRERMKGVRLRIVVCLSHFHPTVGGAERQLLQLAGRWATWGHTVRVITRPVSGLPRRDTVDNIEIRRSIHTLSLGPLFGVTFVISLMANLLRLAHRTDLILAAQAPWEAVATGAIRRITGRPTAVRLANAGPFGDLRQLQRATGRRILTWLVKSNNMFLSLSDQSHEELTHWGCPPERIRRVTNGVDTRLFVPPETTDEQRDRTVLFVGRLSEQKDPLCLLRSWQRVNPEQRYQLLIAGDGHLSSSIGQMIADLKLSNVELLGRCDDLSNVYHRASLFVLPSLSEGCSNALLEAMASGLCPVVTNIGGNRDVITDGVNGRTIEAGDDRQLGLVLSELLTDRKVRDRLSVAARAHVVAHHDVNDVARRYLDEFVRLVE